MTKKSKKSHKPTKPVNEGVTLNFDDNQLAQALFGPQGVHLKYLEHQLGVIVRVKGAGLFIEGDEQKTALAERALVQLFNLLKKGHMITRRDVEKAIQIFEGDDAVSLDDIYNESIYMPRSQKVICPRTVGQKEYIDAIKSHDIVFGVGPAGTGKTYLAMAMAIAAYTQGNVKRIVLARPAIEAGEKLGFLPGDLSEKVNPYLRPLYDALHDMLDFEKTQKMLDRGEIEVAPLAFMRGRTLNDAFVILDEAQNSTKEQMKMFLTRLGFRSKCVITGDVTQIDLPRETRCGLVDAIETLKGIKGICVHQLSSKDVVRHRLVQAIVDAYTNRDQLVLSKEFSNN